MVLRVAFLVLLIYVSYGALLFLSQRKLTFPGAAFPPPSIQGLPPGAERFLLDLPFGGVEAIFLPRAGGNLSAPTILFGHGNAELIEYNVEEFAPWCEAGFNVLLVEYPGYGRSAGSPTQRTLDATWHAAFDWLLLRPEVDRRHIVAMGRSVGSGPTAALAASRPVAAVVLQSAFSATVDFAHERWLPGFLVRDRWDNLAALRAFGGPVLATQGRYDEVIPIRHGERLAMLPNVEFVWMECGHNDCPLFDDSYRAKVLAFLAAHR